MKKQLFKQALSLAVATAADNWNLTGVYCQVNGGAWLAASTANGYTNWNLALNLTAGTNVINVVATGQGSPATRYSLTKSVTINFLSAPFLLQNLRAEITPDDGSTPFEVNFGATTFNQYAWSTNVNDAVGNYTYTNSAPAHATLSLQTIALHQNAYTQTVQLDFTNRNVARLAYVNGNGQTVGATAVFTTVTNLTPTALPGKTLRFVNAQGQVGTWSFQYNNRVIQTLGTQTVTNTWSYQPYGPCGALLTLSAGTQTNWCVFHFETAESAEYYLSNDQASEDTGLAGFDDSLATTVTPPASLSGIELLANSGPTLASVAYDDGQFALLTSDDSLAGTGTYAYTQAGTSTAQVTLNYTAPQASSVSYTVRFFNPSFGIITNTPNPMGVILH
jgi:hypothetical protein